MQERTIVRYPEQILRKKAKAITRLDKGTKTLVDDMVMTMRAANGVGLAANQVGVLQKVFVYDDGNGLGVMVNPEIISAEGEELGVEACLSLPGIQGEVKRATRIIIRAQDAAGKPVKVKAEGWLARILQHEFDHLNGTLFIDRAEPGSLYYVTPGSSDEDEEEPEE